MRIKRKRKRKRQPFVPSEYRPDFPRFIYWVWAAVLVVPVLIALLLQVTG